MGCLNYKRSGRESYAESDFTEDGELRRFEEEIGCHRNTFNSILPKICIEKDLISPETVNNFILRDFNPKLREALNIDFFFKEFNGKKYYDAKKLKMFLFLITLESQVTVKKNYYDKVKNY
jgi:hypothetical protein